MELALRITPEPMPTANCFRPDSNDASRTSIRTTASSRRVKPRETAAEAVVRDEARKNERVLVVEDNDNLRSVAVSNIRQLGYRVVEAATPESALEVIAHGAAPDILFTDVIMPGTMDGIGLAHAIVKLRPNIRVVLTSGFTGQNFEQHDRLPWPLLAKPYRRAQLAAILRSTSGTPQAA